MKTIKSLDWAEAEKLDTRQGMQGQNFATIVSSATVPGTLLCKVLITMPPEHASNVHVHHATDVFVDVLRCGAGGVLTLAGHDLEVVEWTFERQTLYIPPGMPHVAIYPRPAWDEDQVPVVAMETRTTSSPTADITPCDHLAPLLVRRLEELGLTDRVRPSAQMLGARQEPDASCFPLR